MGGDTIVCCPNDGEPLVTCLKYPGREWLCVECLYLAPFFGAAPRVDATPELWARHEANRARKTEAIARIEEPKATTADGAPVDLMAALQDSAKKARATAAAAAEIPGPTPLPRTRRNPMSTILSRQETFAKALHQQFDTSLDGSKAKDWEDESLSGQGYWFRKASALLESGAVFLPDRADHPQEDCSNCGHRSDCSTHNEPGMAAGPCDCESPTTSEPGEPKNG